MLVILVYMYSFFVKISVQPQHYCDLPYICPICPAAGHIVTAKIKLEVDDVIVCLVNPLLCLQDAVVCLHFLILQLDNTIIRPLDVFA